MTTTDAEARVLAAVDRVGSAHARTVAALLWPSSRNWAPDAQGRRGTGVSRKAGSMLAALERRGLTGRAADGSWTVTADGLAVLADRRAQQMDIPL